MPGAVAFKPLAVGLATVTLAAALVGCSSSSRTSSGPSSSASDAASVSGTVVVFAAASLKTAFNSLTADFEREHPGVKVVPSYGGSDSLAAQIVQGAPVDVFASANEATMATVTKADDAQSPRDFAKNELEIAVPPGNPKHIEGLADLALPGVKVAQCAPAVPCGSATVKALEAAKVTVHPVTLEQDVTSVLTKVELDEVDAGFVYRTDVAGAGGKVEGVGFPEASQAVNTYPIAVVLTGKNSRAGQAFVDYVLSADGQQALQRAGFAKP